jgi:two-component system sporulation sensor kinase B
MEFQFEYILLQVLMVLFPIVFFLAIYTDHSNLKKKKFFIGLICVLAISLSLMVPIILQDGIILDLRMVPWYVAFMYGGNVVGISVTLFYFLLRYSIGGIGMIPAFTLLVIMTGVIQFFMEPYQRWPQRKRITFSVLFLVIASSALPILGSIQLHMPFTKNIIILDVFFVLGSAIVTWLAVFLVESHNEKFQLVLDIQRTEKLNVVGQLAASVAHEIRNPMTSVRGFIQLLSSSPNLADEEKQYVSICLEELDRANLIIGDYLSLGKDTNYEKEEILDVTNEMRRSINALHSYAHLRNVELCFDDASSVYIKGYSGMIQQLFINLIKNGIEAIQENGKIMVKVYKKGKEAIVIITDNGVGMKKEQIANLGLPFYSTKEKGTGLGLMVCLRIIKDLGGRIQVKSREGAGTTFEIRFPVKK